MEISTTHKVGDATYRRAAQVLNEQQLRRPAHAHRDTYTTLAMTMNAVEQGVPPGTTASPPAAARATLTVPRGPSGPRGNQSAPAVSESRWTRDSIIS